MASNETGADNALLSGVYRHKGTGAELICIATEKFGNPQAAAAIRVGFEYVGAAPKTVTESIIDPTLQQPDVMGHKSVSELEAELAEAKAREASFAKDESKEEVKTNEVKTETTNKEKGQK